MPPKVARLPRGSSWAIQDKNKRKEKTKKGSKSVRNRKPKVYMQTTQLFPLAQNPKCFCTPTILNVYKKLVPVSARTISLFFVCLLLMSRRVAEMTRFAFRDGSSSLCGHVSSGE